MIHFNDRLEMGNKLKEIENLPDNWNDNGAKAFTKKQIEVCRELLKCLPYTMEIFPVANDSIQFECEHQNEYIKFNVFEDHINAFRASLNTDLYWKYPNIGCIDLINLLKEYRTEEIYERSQVKKDDMIIRW